MLSYIIFNIKGGNAVYLNVESVYKDYIEMMNQIWFLFIGGH